MFQGLAAADGVAVGGAGDGDAAGVDGAAVAGGSSAGGGSAGSPVGDGAGVVRAEGSELAGGM